MIILQYYGYVLSQFDTYSTNVSKKSKTVYEIDSSQMGFECHRRSESNADEQIG